MPLGSPALPGVHGLAFNIHHGPAVPPSQEIAGQPCCSVAHTPPSLDVHVSRHAHSGKGGEEGGGGEGGGVDGAVDGGCGEGAAV